MLVDSCVIMKVKAFMITTGKTVAIVTLGAMMIGKEMMPASPKIAMQTDACIPRTGTVSVATIPHTLDGTVSNEAITWRLQEPSYFTSPG